tara:strand:+ start:5145 stop:6212 length:1068 start_codon:yes stop_codon:yes gene_type:complete
MSAREPIIRTIDGDTGHIQQIKNRLADNNAGEIGASDVRETMFDLAKSIPFIIASGQWNVSGRQFIKDVELIRYTENNQEDGGTLIVHSGIVFQTPDGNGGRQTEPFPGVEGINHLDLDNLEGGDPHPQYLNRNDMVRDIVGSLGGSSPTNSLGMGANNWIRESGVSVRNTSGDHTKGLRFEHTGVETETVHVGSGTIVKFDKDGSQLDSARSTAKAWISFSSVSGNLGNPTASVYSSYGIKKLQRMKVNENGDGVTYVPQAGHFKIWFNDGMFDSGDDYLAIGTSNARQDVSSASAMELNSVAIVERTSNYCTFYVLDDENSRTDAARNDVIIFGLESGATYDDNVVVEDANDS